MAHNRKPQRRATVLIIVALIAILVASVAGVMFRKVMIVKNIRVEGISDAQTVQEIKETSGVRLGQSIFDIDPHTIEISLRADGYIELCSVDIQRPDTVVLNVRERGKAAAVQYLGFTYVLDSELNVLEICGALSDAGTMLINGANVQQTPVGFKLNIDQMAATLVKSLISAISEAGLSDIVSEVNITNAMDIFMVSRSGLVFRLGDSDALADKLRLVTPMLEQLTGEGKTSGTVDISNGGSSADYTPPHTTPEPTAIPVWTTQTPGGASPTVDAGQFVPNA